MMPLRLFWSGPHIEKVTKENTRGERHSSAPWSLREASGQESDMGPEPRSISASLFQGLKPITTGSRQVKGRELVAL